jgi:hypothetical protein
MRQLRVFANDREDSFIREKPVQMLDRGGLAHQRAAQDFDHAAITRRKMRSHNILEQQHLACLRRNDARANNRESCSGHSQQGSQGPIANAKSHKLLAISWGMVILR